MTTYYVRKSGSDGNSGLTELLAKLTIASAITASTTGDTIDIGVGTWAENINSSRVYRGVSMYKSIISAVTSQFSALTLTIQNIKLVQSSLAYGGIVPTQLTYLDARHDFSAVVPATAYWLFTGNMIATRSIFIGNSTGYSGEILTSTAAGKTYTIDHCIFYELFSANLIKPSVASVSMTNTIWHIASKATAQSVCISAAAMVLEQYNCFYSALSTFSNLPGGAFGTGTKNNVNPLFRDAVGGDFNLSDDSPCIGAGHA